MQMPGPAAAAGQMGGNMAANAYAAVEARRLFTHGFAKARAGGYTSEYLSPDGQRSYTKTIDLNKIAQAATNSSGTLSLFPRPRYRFSLMILVVGWVLSARRCPQAGRLLQGVGGEDNKEEREQNEQEEKQFERGGHYG